MAYKEKNFQQEFKTKNTNFGCFELKLCKGKSLPFSAIAEHQIAALLAVSSPDGLYHKLTDQPVSIQEKTKNMRFTRPKPFDCFFLQEQAAEIVIMFYVPRKKKTVYYIDISDFVEMKRKATRKSITEDMAQVACSEVKSYMK